MPFLTLARACRLTRPLHQLEMDDDMAAMASLFFPLAGTFSAFLGGYLVDRIPSKHRGTPLKRSVPPDISRICPIKAEFRQRSAPSSRSTCSELSFSLATLRAHLRRPLRSVLRSSLPSGFSWLPRTRSRTASFLWYALCCPCRRCLTPFEATCGATRCRNRVVDRERLGLRGRHRRWLHHGRPFRQLWLGRCVHLFDGVLGALLRRLFVLLVLGHTVRGPFPFCPLLIVAQLPQAAYFVRREASAECSRRGRLVRH